MIIKRMNSEDMPSDIQIDDYLIIQHKQMNDIVKELREVTNKLMFGSPEGGTNVACENKYEQDEAVWKTQNS